MADVIHLKLYGVNTQHSGVDSTDELNRHEFIFESELHISREDEYIDGGTITKSIMAIHIEAASNAGIQYYRPTAKPCNHNTLQIMTQNQHLIQPSPISRETNTLEYE